MEETLTEGQASLERSIRIVAISDTHESHWEASDGTDMHPPAQVLGRCNPIEIVFIGASHSADDDLLPHNVNRR
jgi:hypothetical protein